ncbi:MAG: hypothetical protein QM630_00980 [Microbacterium sp.]
MPVTFTGELDRDAVAVACGLSGATPEYDEVNCSIGCLGSVQMGKAKPCTGVIRSLQLGMDESAMARRVSIIVIDESLTIDRDSRGHALSKGASVAA